MTSESQTCYVNCGLIKKRIYNYSSNNASTRTFSNISNIVNTTRNSSVTTVSLQLNPFKSYGGSIAGFGAPIRNKF